MDLPVHPCVAASSMTRGPVRVFSPTMQGVSLAASPQGRRSYCRQQSSQRHPLENPSRRSPRTMRPPTWRLKGVMTLASAVVLWWSSNQWSQSPCLTFITLHLGRHDERYPTYCTE